MLEQLIPQKEWLIIESENHKIINENEVHYLLKNGIIIKVSLNLYTYNREVSVYKRDGEQGAYYPDLSKNQIIEKIRMYETF